jgi:hypothetical protein
MPPTSGRPSCFMATEERGWLGSAEGGMTTPNTGAAITRARRQRRHLRSSPAALAAVGLTPHATTPWNERRQAAALIAQAGVLVPESRTPGVDGPQERCCPWHQLLQPLRKQAYADALAVLLPLVPVSRTYAGPRTAALPATVSCRDRRQSIRRAELRSMSRPASTIRAGLVEGLRPARPRMWQAQCRGLD